MDNLDVSSVCVKYDLDVVKMKSLPLLIKGMVEKMVRENKLQSYLLGEDKLYALGTLIYLFKIT